MCEPTGCVRCCMRGETYCDRCDVLVGLPGLHVIKVVADKAGGGLTVTVESPPAPVGCPVCGVIAASHGRRTVVLVDAPCFGRPVRVVWRKRTWRCREPACPGRSFTEQDERVCRPRGLLTVRACWWAISQLRAEHASIHGLARQLGTTWRTVWCSITPLLEAMADDPSRFDGVASLGVDEHLWHHVDERRRGSRALTGMVDLTRDQQGRVRARLLDLVAGPLGEGLRRLAQRPRRGVPEAGAHRDVGSVPRLQERHRRPTRRRHRRLGRLPCGEARHPGRRGGPPPSPARHHRPSGPQGRPALPDPRTCCARGVERLTERQQARLNRCIEAGDPHVEVVRGLAVRPAAALRSTTTDPAAGRRIAFKMHRQLPHLPDPRDRPTRPDPETPGRHRSWPTSTPHGVSNGGTEAICECGGWLVWDWLVRMVLVALPGV